MNLAPSGCRNCGLAFARLAEHDPWLCGDHAGAAHMSGTRSGGKHAGGDADAAIFSFQAVKNLPTADAGMICFEDRRLDEEVRKWAWMGINKDTYARSLSGGEYKWLYEVEHPGFKYHGNSIMGRWPW